MDDIDADADAQNPVLDPFLIILTDIIGITNPQRDRLVNNGVSNADTVMILDWAWTL